VVCVAGKQYGGIYVSCEVSGAGFILRVLVLARAEIRARKQPQKNQYFAMPFTLNQATPRREFRLSSNFNQREIPRFARNDKIFYSVTVDRGLLIRLLAYRGHSDPIGKSVFFFRNAEELVHIGFFPRKQLVAFDVAHPSGRVSLGILNHQLK
jgi:hypothetical protein